MVAFKKDKKVVKKVVVLDDEKRVKENFPKCEVKKTGEKVSILTGKKGKVLSTDKNIDNAWKKALHSIL
jgi:hypothetical protein